MLKSKKGENGFLPLVVEIHSPYFRNLTKSKKGENGFLPLVVEIHSPYFLDLYNIVMSLSPKKLVEN